MNNKNNKNLHIINKKDKLFKILQSYTYKQFVNNSQN